NAVLTAAERPMLSVYNAVPLLPLVLVAHWIVIPRAGAVGAAAVTATFASIGAIVGAVLVGRVWGAFPPWTTCARCLVLAVVAFVAAHSWQTSGIWLVAKLALVSALVVGGFVALGELDAAERRLVTEAIVRRRRGR